MIIPDLSLSELPDPERVTARISRELKIPDWIVTVQMRASHHRFPDNPWGASLLYEIQLGVPGFAPVIAEFGMEGIWGVYQAHQEPVLNVHHDRVDQRWNWRKHLQLIVGFLLGMRERIVGHIEMLWQETFPVLQQMGQMNAN